MKNITWQCRLIALTLSGVCATGWAAAKPNQEERIGALKRQLETATDRQRVDLLNELSRTDKTMRGQQALRVAQEALALSRQLGYREGEATALANLSVCYFRQGEYPTALTHAHDALEISKALGEQGPLADALNVIGNIYHDKGEFDKALKYYGESLKIREQANDIAKLPISLHNIGQIHCYQSAHQQCLQYCQRANDMLGQIDPERVHPALEVSALNCIGHAYYGLNRYNKALEHHLSVLNKAEQAANQRMIYTALNNIGVLYRAWDKPERALTYHQRGLKVVEALGSKRGIGTALDNIGVDHFELKKYGAALTFSQQALDLRREIGDKAGIAASLQNLGRTHEALGQLETSLERHLESLAIHEEIGARDEVAESLRDIGDVYIKLKDYAKAGGYLERGQTIAAELNKKKLSMELFHSTYQLFKHRGDYQKSLEFHEKFFQTFEAIFNEKSARQISEIQERFEAEKKAAQIASLHSEKALLARDNQIKEITRNAFVLGFALVLVILFLLFRKYLFLFAFWQREKVVGPYRIGEQIGSGGMGVVYRAQSVLDKTKPVAVKLLRDSSVNGERSSRRFKREAMIIDKLDHPNIVKIEARGTHQGKTFIALELLEGQTLQNKINRESPIALAVCLRIMKQICDAVRFIHEKEVIHRDLKPGNIMLVRDGREENTVKLLDFGIAKARHQTELTETGGIVGSYTYMSPEQISNGAVSYPSDVYSMGTIFFELVTGEIPVQVDDLIALRESIVTDAPRAAAQLRPEIPTELNGLILEMMDKDAAARPTAAQALKRVSLLIREQVTVSPAGEAASGVGDDGHDGMTITRPATRPRAFR